MDVSTIKEKIKACFRLKYFLPVSLGALILAVILRTVQIFVVLDFQTGFFNRDSLVVPLLNVVLILFCIYLVVQSVVDKPKEERIYEGRRLKPYGVITAVTAAVTALGGLFSWFNAAGTSQDNMLFYLELLLQLGAGAALFYHAYLFLNQNGKSNHPHMLLLIPAVWSVVHLLGLFLEHTTIASISEYVFEILFYADAVLFLFFLARYVAGFKKSGGQTLLFSSGALLTMLGAVSSVPMLVGKLFGCDIAWPDFVALALAVFAGGTVYLIATRDRIPLPEKGSNDIQGEYLYETVRVGRLV